MVLRRKVLPFPTLRTRGTENNQQMNKLTQVTSLYAAHCQPISTPTPRHKRTGGSGARLSLRLTSMQVRPRLPGSDSACRYGRGRRALPDLPRHPFAFLPLSHLSFPVCSALLCLSPSLSSAPESMGTGGKGSGEQVGAGWVVGSSGGASGLCCHGKATAWLSPRLCDLLVGSQKPLNTASTPAPPPPVAPPTG